MRILWISFLGSWTIPLLNTIKNNSEVALAIPLSDKSAIQKEESAGITYYKIPISQKENISFMSLKVFLKYKEVINDFKPDIIHVHGTEKNLAQIQNFLKNIPVVISIQGLMTGYKAYARNYLNNSDIIRFKSLKNILGKGGINLQYNNFCKGALYEKDILKKGKYFIGRTHWDKAHVCFHNSNAYYYHGEELLRAEFYDNIASWNIKKCRRHSIFMPSGFNPIKGLHLAIEATYLLKQYFPDVLLVVPGLNLKIEENSKLSNPIWGEEYIRYCKHLIIQYNLKNNITFFSRLDALGMIHQMKQANVFVSPSSIDNSPNAVGESTMIGVPIVTTPTGGVPSFMKDEETALFAPAGDPYMIAYQVKRIFEDDDLAIRLSKNAHKLALVRHDKKKTGEQYLNIYEDILKKQIS